MTISPKEVRIVVNQSKEFMKFHECVDKGFFLIQIKAKISLICSGLPVIRNRQ